MLGGLFNGILRGHKKATLCVDLKYRDGLYIPNSDCQDAAGKDDTLILDLQEKAGQLNIVHIQEKAGIAAVGCEYRVVWALPRKPKTADWR